MTVLEEEKSAAVTARHFLKEELDALKIKHHELKTDTVQFWKTIHSVGLPSGCLGMGEDAFQVPDLSEPLANNTEGEGVAAAAAAEVGAAALGDGGIPFEGAAGAAAGVVTKVLPTFENLKGHISADFKDWVREIAMGSCMNDITNSNFAPSPSTTMDETSFGNLLYKTIGILTFAKPHSAGRLWEYWAPVNVILSLVRRYPGTCTYGSQLNIHDILNMSYTFKGERSELVYGRVRANLLGLEAVADDSPSYIYFVKARDGQKIAPDGGISAGTTGPADGSGGKGKGKTKWKGKGGGNSW